MYSDLVLNCFAAAIKAIDSKELIISCTGVCIHSRSIGDCILFLMTILGNTIPCYRTCNNSWTMYITSASFTVFSRETMLSRTLPASTHCVKVRPCPVGKSTAGRLHSSHSTCLIDRRGIATPPQCESTARRHNHDLKWRAECKSDEMAEWNRCSKTDASTYTYLLGSGC